ncbi:hypothetical protein KC842_02520 [Candidatus Nomurabacteria bacterium]|nr:hypothetical protein [Candidatus Nomurabacteria bacterium]
MSEKQLSIDFPTDHFLLQNKSPLPGYKTEEIVTYSSSGKRKVRVICKPNETLRIMHDIMKEVLSPVYNKKNLPYAYQWIKGISTPPIAALQHHKENRKFYPRHWFVTDLKSAYHSMDLIEASIYVEIFCQINGINPVIDWTISMILYCTDPNMTLAEGLPVSPWLFNIYAHYKLDIYLALLAHKYNARYSRLGDDLIFSSPEPFGKRKRKAILGFVRNQGFTISERKTKVIDLTKNHGASINGIGIRNTVSKGELFLPRDYRAKIKGLLHVALYGLDENGRLNDPSNFPEINGMMAIFKKLVPKNVDSWTKDDDWIVENYEIFRESFHNKAG